jgi:multidrug efflux pump subunit AcrA (membrane-fusion protein)
MARRPALTTLALAALAAAAIVVAVLVVGSPATSSAQERTATVERGVIQSTVSGSGNLEPANQTDVDFATSGEITHIYVKEGQHVAEDEILAKVDPAAANVDLAQAEADLQSAQDALVQAETPTTTTTTTAQSSGSKGANGGSSSGSGSGSSSGSSSGSGSGSSSGATSTMTVAAAQANVDSAQLSVQSAEKAVAATTLRAPMAGTVTAVNGSVGQTVSGGSSSSSSSSSSSTGSNGASVAGGLGGGGASSSSSSASGGSSFITLAQVSRFKMEVSLSESDIGSVKVGQPATVTVNAASGEQFAARVADIGVLSSSSSSGSSSSAVSYPVTLSLDQTGKSLKAGMSATADIVTSQVTGMAVPSQALSGSTVTVEAADGAQTTQRVQTGVVGNSTTQIVSGLKVGDKVVVRSTAAALGAGAAGSNQLNSAIGSRLGGGGLGGGLAGGGGFGGGGGGGGGFRGAGGGGGRTP